MAKVWQASIVDGNGNVLPSASVEVRNADSLALATIYSDAAETTPLINPMTADANGFARFYVATGSYRVTATSGAFTRVWENVIIGAPVAAMDLAGVSVAGRALATTGAAAAITAAANNSVLKRVSDVLQFAQVAYADIENASACSVLGRATNSSGVLADIQAGTNDRLLTRVSDVVAFTQLTAGMFPSTVVPDAALSSNVPLINAVNTWTGARHIFSTTGGGLLDLVDSNAATDTQRYRIEGNGTTFGIQLRTDADAFSSYMLQATRSGLTITQLTLNATELEFNGTTLDINAAADFSSYAVFNGNQATSNATIRLSTALPSLVLTETDQAADQQNWRIDSEGGAFRVRAYNDAFTVVADALRILRTTTTVDEVELNATLLDVNAAADFSSTILAAGVITAKAASSATTGSVRLDAATNPGIFWDDGAAAADAGNWLLYSSAGTLRWRVYNDAGSVNSEFLTVARSTTTVTQITLAATELQFDGTTLDINAAADISGNLVVGGDILGDSASAGTLISGGTTAGLGAHITLYAQSHATLANRAYYDGSYHFFRSESGGTATEFEVNATLIDLNGVVDCTSLVVATKTVSEGAADSGGAGYKVLRVPN